MERYLKNQIIQDLNKKMVFLDGPRQVGKTTLAKQIGPENSYLNWDDSEDRENILKAQLPPTTLWIFDEIHKYKKWRNFLKGLYDKNQKNKKILVTGSAKLDLYRRGGDSLQGRYHYLRLHPLSFDEIGGRNFKDLENLFTLGGFPEPFLNANKIDAKRWTREYRQRILQDDILSIEHIEDIGTAELLMLRLPELVGSTLSINSLSEDLQVSHKTISRWLGLFENFYAIFRINSFGSSRIKAIKKARKHYHFDWTLVHDEGARFENLIACQLLKWSHFFQDTQGREVHLHFMGDLEQREVDFVITEDNKPKIFIECKLSEKNVSKSLQYLKNKFPKVPAYQILYQSIHDFQTDSGIRVGPAHKLLNEIKTQILD